jgi:hypothetical protein
MTPPMEVLLKLLAKLREQPGTENVRLEDLVTKESLPLWQQAMGTTGLKTMLSTMGVAGHTRWVSPKVARFVLPKMHPEAEPITVEHPTLVEAHGAEVRYVDEVRGWRVHEISGNVRTDSPN